ncbi:MAG: glycosyltransferase family 39 protein [Planctomycetes bacterium]|nr:glycosyltransferase family 39 protein [Planctomycetota bacterium]
MLASTWFGARGVWLAATLAALVFLIRAPALWYAYPFEGTADERVIVDHAVEIVRSGDPHPRAFNYPSLHVYAASCAFALLERCGVLAADPRPTPEHFLVARAMVLALAALGVFATARLGARAFGERVGLLSAAVLACLPLHFVFSFVARVDVGAATWSVCAVLVALCLLDGASRSRDWLLAALFVGLATGSKYTACVAGVPVLAAFALARPRPPFVRLASFCLVAPLVFLATSPYVVLDPRGFGAGIAEVRDAYRSNLPGHSAGGATSYLAVLGDWHRGLGLGVLSSAAFGVVRAWRWQPRATLVLLACPAALFGLLGAYPSHFARNSVVVAPFAALFASHALLGVCEWGASRFAAVARSTRRARLVAIASSVVLVGFVLLEPTRVSAAEWRAARLADVRGPALEWIREHLEPGARILCEQRGPPLATRAPAFDVTEVRCAVEARARTRAETFDYVVLTDWTRRAVAQDPERFTALVDAYAEFAASHALVAEFVADGVRFGGDSIRVYRGVQGAATQ